LSGGVQNKTLLLAEVKMCGNPKNLGWLRHCPGHDITPQPMKGL